MAQVTSSRAAGSLPLPIPCSPGACGNSGPSKFVTAGSATAVATKNSLTVNQTSTSTILNWSSFDIGAGNTVNFVQPNSSAIALNRIFEASPSQIFGKLTANGQIYLINLNGFLFGKTATVNVGGLLASSLPLSLTDQNFSNGILSPLQNGAQAVFDANLDPLAQGGRTSVLDANGKPVLDANGKPIAVQVVVQPGAQITASDQGRILLTGQDVINGGTLTAPDGQVILAAGTQVYLQADTDPGLRGLIVEVDGTTTTSANGTTSVNTAMNQVSGVLSAPRGDVWMVGLAVNQDGRISASTSVAANGSIHLEAASQVAFGSKDGATTVSSTQGGALTIGPNSQMSIGVDTSGGSAVAAQTQLASTITLLGEQVDIQGGSITAPGGTLTAIAAANPSLAATTPTSATTPYAITGVTSTPDPNARLHIDAGTNIDLSGSSASLPVTANLVEAQLRSSELADDPNQRNGALHGDTVYIDLRNGSPPIANLSGEIAAIPQTIQQRTEAGGHATFQSEGDAVFAAGATLNVSGGASTYAGGMLQTSYLIGANGQLYNIATANPLLTYIGVVNPTFTQTYNTWGVQNEVPTTGLSAYQPGYVQGAAAGSVQFAAPNMVIQGRMTASTVDGIYQRTPATAAAGGTLTIGVPGGVINNTSATDFLSPAIELTNSPVPIAVGDDTTLTGPHTLQLPVSYLTSSGFTTTNLYSNDDVTLAAGTPLTLPGGASLTMTAARVDVLSSITDPNGSLSFQNVFALGATGTPALRPGVYVADGISLDVRGLFTNDLPSANGGVISTGETWQNGGSINFGVSSVGSMLSLGDNVSLHASGGAWYQANGTLTPGTGGSIGINATGIDDALSVGKALSVDAFGVQGAKGGSFSLSAPRIEISNGTAAGWTLAQTVDDLPPAAPGGTSSSTGASPPMAPGGTFEIFSNLFSDYGFQNFNLTATGLVPTNALNSNVLTVDAGTHVNATVSTLFLNQNAPRDASASGLTGIAAVTSLPLYQQNAASVSLNALPNPQGTIATFGTTPVGDIFVGQGASIATAPGGSIAMTGLDSIVVDGALRAQGGTVALEVLAPVNKYVDYDAGFLQSQRIELGGTGSIDVSGTFVPKPVVQGLNLGTLSAGGTVDLFADRGVVLTDAGSHLSVAGASAGIDVKQPNGSYAPEVAASAGGSISVRSGEAISLIGDISAAAGSGSTSGSAPGGSLELDLTRGQQWWGVATVQSAASFNQAPLVVELEPTVPSTVPPTVPNGNQAVLGAAQIAASGLDSVHLVSANTLELSSTFSLNLGSQLILDAPVIEANTGAKVSLSAPYLQVGYTSLPQVPNTSVATSGTGSLRFSGNEIDLEGLTVFQGASNVVFSSSGDLKLTGGLAQATDTAIHGGLTVQGNLVLDASRIYPTTGTSFAIVALEDPASGAPGTVAIGQTTPSAGTPLSADGSVSISAYSISSSGSLYAPFGSIALNGTNSVTLGDGSLTSVSGNGLIIPFGATEFAGESWTYLFDYTSSAPDGVRQVISGIPNRAVSITAPAVAIESAATVDVSGGGDLSAYEWVPGPGGSKDALAPGTVPGLYAVLPSTKGQAAPSDPQSTDPSILPGETVYLSGGNGLAPGTYPLLPARYALLPGAYLIQVEQSFQSPTQGSLGMLADGTPVVAGYLSYGNTSMHLSPGYTGFAIYPGSYGSKLAAYDNTLASAFFAAQASATSAPRPNLPQDSGSLSIAVTDSLNATGRVLSTPASGGIGAPIEIAASDLVIGNGGTAPPGAVSISGSVLDSWQAGSLLLGGETTASAILPSDGVSSSAPLGAATHSTSSIEVLANSVTIAPGTTVTAGQVILAANQTIDVQSGAKVQSDSAAGAALNSLPGLQQVTLSNPEAAFIGVSDLNWLTPVRSGSSAVGGTVSVASGATLASKGSLSVDAPGGVTLLGMLSGVGAEWSLGSSSIALASVDSHDTLLIDSNLLAAMGSASALRLASSTSIDIGSPVSLGVNGSSPTLNSLTLEASSINNQAGGNSQFGAKVLVLEGLGATSPGTAATGNSELKFVADEMAIGPNALAVTGFAGAQFAVSGALIGQGSGAVNVAGDLSISSGVTTAATAANTTLSATGTLTVEKAATPSGLPTLLGGTLNLQGNDVQVAGNLAAPAGSLNIQAANNLNIESTARLSAQGSLVTIGNQTVAAPAGTIIASAGGAMNLGEGAVLDVSGAGAGSAGSIALTAGGAATLDATFKGVSSGTGGSFSLDVGSLAGNGNMLTPLAANLAAGGFSNTIDLRLRSGDMTLAAGSKLEAQSVSLTADRGSVLIDGKLLAPSGNLRGQIDVFGGNGVEIGAGAVLAADGSGANGRGGDIEIGAGELQAGASGLLNEYNTATIALDAGSTISAGGAAGKGTLTLRAPALIASGDVGISAFAANTTDVGRIVIEPVLPYNTADTTYFSSATTPTSTDFGNVGNSVSTYMASAGGNIGARLVSASGTPVVVQPGVEIIAPGALTLPADGLDLSQYGLNWQYGANPQPVVLTVRAAGNLEVAGTLSDGFANQQVGDDSDGGLLQPTLLFAPSASFRLVAGADLSSANPMAVARATAANLTLDPHVVVRTGTGNIDLLAAGNVVLAGAGSGAYTAGTPALAPGGTVDVPYPQVSPDRGTTAPNTDQVQGNPINYGMFVPGTSVLTSFPTGGGNLTVRAGGDIDNLSTTPVGSVTTWQVHEPASIDQTPDWGVNLLAYNYNFGTLGGGDLKVAAQGSATNLSLAASNSLLPQQAGATPAYVPSGGVAFSAGKDIGSAQVFLGDGTGTVSAGGALTATLPAVVPGSANVGSAFYLESSAIDVNARLGAVIDGVFNPSSLGQPLPNGLTNLPRQMNGSFFSYGDDSALSVQTVAGDLLLGSSSAAAQTILGAGTIRANPQINIYPASVSYEALSGNLIMSAAFGSPILYPSPTGALNLLAAQDIAGNGTLGGGRIVMSDALPGSIATVTDSATTSTALTSSFGGDLHMGDSTPATVTAGRDINNLAMVIPQATQIVAGRDISNLTFTGQNLSPEDLTLISAGRDITNATNGAMSVGGPGSLDLLAGRNISLGFSQGVVTTGNLLNPNLPTSQGADITMVTGLGGNPDYAGFLKNVIEKSKTYQQQLIAYVESVQGSSGLTLAQAENAFGNLNLNQQRPFIDQVFFNELDLSGFAANHEPGAGFSQGYAAIDALFPGSRSASPNAVSGAYAGDLTLQFSRIYTLSGGNINLVVPGGGIDVGLANPPSTLTARPASTLGIVAEGPGNVDIFAKNDVNVNSSRIFTLGGGNILIWSNEGSIDAGLGAKTSVSAPPPSILINSNGTVTIDFSGAATGSGIRTIQTSPTTPAGNVDLIAPVGTVNAGDAGIGASGNINIAAQSVVGATNISFGGTASGVPATVSSVSASLSGASNAASGTSNAAANTVAGENAEKDAAAPLAQTALSWLDVFVTGLGEENCKTDDIECLKRQKTPAH